MQPIVSVLMTAFNRENYISQSIESVLSSEYGDLELIIVDDASTDSTVEIALNYAKVDSRIKLNINEKNLGDYPNRNKAATLAKGIYLKYLDSDDIMYPHCLGVMLGSMKCFPEAGFGLSSSGDSSKPFPLSLSPREAYLEHFHGKGHFNRAPGSSIIRASAFHEVGGFSGKRMIGDYELWFILARKFNMVKFPVDLYWARKHEGQESNSEYAKKYNVLRNEVLEEALSNPNCPLTKGEISLIRKKNISRVILNKILNKIR